MKINHFFHKKGHMHGEQYPAWRKWNRRSLPFKLLGMLLLAGLVVEFAVGAFFHFSGKHSQLKIARNLENYAEYLIKDLGNPPDTLRARLLLTPLALDLRYQGPSFFWATNPDLPNPEQFRKHHLGHGSVPLGWKQGRFMLLVEADGGIYLFATAAKPYGLADKPLLCLLLFLTILFLIAFFRMRHMLAPIQGLEEGVKQIGEGNFAHRISVCGIDELGRLARAFNEMAARLQELIRSKEQLLLDVSHELRSPLTRAKVALELPWNEATKASVLEDLQEMEKMLAEILESERLKSTHGVLRLESCDLVEIASEIMNRLENQVPGIVWVGQKTSVSLLADKARLQVVLRNLLENALKYSKADSASVEMSIQNTKSEAIICIQDFGQGIPGSDVERVFEPFYRIDPSRNKDTGGFGLGLSLCRKIIQAHGGSIHLESQLGVGTTVTVKLPISNNI